MEKVRGCEGRNHYPVLDHYFLVGGFQVATQYFAYKFNYQPQLGVNLNHINVRITLKQANTDLLRIFMIYPKMVLQLIT